MADTKRLIAEVAVRHGICLASNDPALALVTLNELVLEDAIQNAVEKVRTANKDFEGASERLQERAGSLLAQQINSAVAATRSELALNVDQATAQAIEKLKTLQRFQTKFAFHWTIAGVIAALIIFAAGILLGMTFR